MSVNISMEKPERSSRAKLLFAPFFVIGPIFGLIFQSIGMGFLTLFASVAILFTGKYPEGMWNYNKKVFIKSTKLNAFLSHLTDDTKVSE